MIRAFPRTRFIAGHSGLLQFKDVLELLSGFPNFWTDVSFQPPGNIRKLIGSFGAERVLNGSDWPWGRMNVSIKTVKRACRGDASVLKRMLFENAAELMRLPLQVASLAYPLR